MSSAQTGRITFQRPCPSCSVLRPCAWNKLRTWWMNTPGTPPVLLSNGAYNTGVCLWPILINGTWNSGSRSFQICFCFFKLTPCTQVSKANEQARSFWLRPASLLSKCQWHLGWPTLPTALGTKRRPAKWRIEESGLWATSYSLAIVLAIALIRILLSLRLPFCKITMSVCLRTACSITGLCGDKQLSHVLHEVYLESV